MKKLFPLFLVVTVISCNQSGNTVSQNNADAKTVTTPANWKAYSNDTCSIQYPPEWTVKEKFMGTEFALLSPIDSTSPTFAENVNLTKQDMTGKEQSLEKVVPATIELLKTIATNFTLLSSTLKKDAAGVEYQQIIYTCNQGTLPLKQEQQYRIIKNTAYILTLTTLQNGWDKGYKVGEQIMATFSVK
jgi:hypothetical protein